MLSLSSDDGVNYEQDEPEKEVAVAEEECSICGAHIFVGEPRRRIGRVTWCDMCDSAYLAQS